MKQFILQMPTCVECGHPVSSLFTEYSKGNIRLTQCDHCKKFADAYIEHDLVLIFIDMLLHKPQVYRHLLFNRLAYRDNGMDPNVVRLGVLLVLFDVYVKWLHLERQPGDVFSQSSIAGRYISILSLSICGTFISVHLTPIEFVAMDSVIRLLVKFHCRNYAIVKYNYVSMGLILSSFAKLLLILMIIWDYSLLEYSWLVHCLVFSSNAEALSVFLEVDYVRAFCIVFIGVACRSLVQLAWTF